MATQATNGPVPPGPGDAELFRLFMESVTDYAIFMLDPEGIVVRWNSGAERMLGYSEAEAIGQSFSRFFTPEDVARGVPEKELQTAITRGSATDDRWHMRKDGTRYWITGMTTALRDGSGGLRGFAKVTRDWTRQKQLEDELRRQHADRAQLNHVLALAHVLIRDVDDRIVFWSEGAATMYGWSAAEAVGKVSHELLQTQFPQPLETIRTVLKERGVWHGELIHKTKFGARLVVASHWAMHYNGDGKPVSILEANNDITELRQVREELQQADRRKDEFLAVLAHELRNPLAPIHNAIHILQLRNNEDPDVRWAREVIERQLRHLARLVDDLLDVSRIRRGKIQLRRERVELHALVSGAVETSKPLIESRRHHLTVTLPEAPVWIEGDPTRLAQVLGNLLTNAAKYTEEGGQIALLGERQADTLLLRVRDNGIGISPEMLPRVFDLFAQADRALHRAQGGLGIGLALVRRLVELHGGQVEAHSAGTGHGSEFIVRLPLPAEPKLTQHNGSHAPPAPGVRPLRVLIVDDSEDTAESLAMILRLANHEVHIAHDGPGALVIAQATPHDIVLLDIGLPGMDGYEVARRLRQLPGMEEAMLVAITGFGQDEHRRRALEAGIDAYLTKPAAPEKVQELLAKSRKPQAHPPRDGA